MIVERKKNLKKYVVPAILGNASYFLFTVVDGIFVGNGVGTDALGAVNLALPFILLATALYMMVSIGGVTIVAIRIGRGDVEGAQSAFMHSVASCVLVGILITVVGVFFARPVAVLMGAKDHYIPLVIEYVVWWSAFALPSALSLNFMGFCRNDGSPSLVAVATVLGTVVNIILDWLFVFPLQMGLTGAAVATGISQTVSMAIVATHFLRKKGVLRFCRFKMNIKLYNKTAYRGLPEAIAQLSTPVNTLCINYVLIEYFGSVGVNAFSVISYISSFTMAVFFGVSEGLQPLFGQSYGAKNGDDLKYYYKAGWYISLIGSALCVVIYVLFATPLCKLFGADPNTTHFTVVHMWEYCWGFVVASINTLLSAYFFSTKRSIQAIILNVARSLVFNVAIISLLPAMFGGSIVWHTFGIYEIFVLVVGLALKKHSERNGIVYQ